MVQHTADNWSPLWTLRQTRDQAALQSSLLQYTAKAQSFACSHSCHLKCKKVKVAHTQLPSAWFRSWSQFSLQVTWVINPAITFRQAHSHPGNPQEGCYQFRCLVNRGMMGVNSLPKTVTRQHRGCNLNPCPSALESSTLTAWLPSHPLKCTAQISTTADPVKFRKLLKILLWSCCKHWLTGLQNFGIRWLTRKKQTHVPSTSCTIWKFFTDACVTRPWKLST